MAVKDLWKVPDPNGSGKLVMIPMAERTGKRWQADWTEANGKRRRARFATQVEAKQYHDDQIRRVRGGSTIDPSDAKRRFVYEVFESFMIRLRTQGARGGKPASVRTLDKHERVWRDYIEPRWGNTRLSEIQYGEVSDWITGLRSKKNPDAFAGDATRSQVSMIFQTVMKHAMRLRWIEHNPALNGAGEADYKPKVKTAKNHVCLPMEHLLLLVDQLRPADTGADALLERDRAILLTAGLCGLRWGEVIALQAGDVTLGDKPQLKVQRAYTDASKANGGLVAKETKNGDDRIVPLPKLLADTLAMFVAGVPKGQLLFRSVNGFPVRYGRFMSDTFKPAVERAHELSAGDVEPIPARMTFHDLRHTAVSLAISGGANVKVVQRIAGHKSATLTLDTYADLFTKDLHDSAARIDGALTRHLDSYRHLFVTQGA